MRNALFTSLFILSCTANAQIKSFDLEKVDYLYVSYSAGDIWWGQAPDLSNGYDFLYQWTDFVEIGGMYNVWKKLYVSAGIGIPLNYKDLSDFSVRTTSGDNWGDQNVWHMRGPQYNFGLSYGLKAGKITILPNVSVLLANQTRAYIDYNDIWNRDEFGEVKLPMYAIMEIGADIVYKNILIGVGFQDFYYNFNNVSEFTIRLGYGFERKNLNAKF
jgi:hypothetical protein